MSRNRKVVAVVLNWNRWRDTLRCLRSLAELGDPRLAIVVVDNGSDDGSAAHLRAAALQDELIENAENRGFAAAVNQAARTPRAREADYLWLVNNDAVVLPRCLDELLEVAEADPRIGITGSVAFFDDACVHVEGWGGGTVSLWTGMSRHATGPGQAIDYVTGASMLVRRRMLDEIGLLDEIFFVYFEDTDLSFRALAAGWKIAVAEHSRVVHAESATLGRFSRTQAYCLFRGLAIFLRRYAPVPALAVLVRLAHQTAWAVYRRRWPALAGAWSGARDGWKLGKGAR